MKTAQQWLDSEQWHETGDREILRQIEAIQADVIASIKPIREALVNAISVAEDHLDYRPDDEAANEWAEIKSALKIPLDTKSHA